MEGITLNMMENDNAQKQVEKEWIDAFIESMGIGSIKISDLQLLDDTDGKLSGDNTNEEKLYSAQGGLFGKKKYAKEIMNDFKKSKSEFLVTREDAEEVISCCLWVLDTIYGIHFNISYSVKLYHLHESAKPIMIKNIPELDNGVKTLRKKKRPERLKNKGRIGVLYNSSYITLVIAFLRRCFETETGRPGPQKTRTSVCVKTSENSEEYLESGYILLDKDKESSSISTDNMKIEADDGEEQGEVRVEDKKKWEGKEPHVITWLVAHCLCIMGELAYAKQYITNYRNEGMKEEFDEICEWLGVPWTTQESVLKENILFGRI